MKKIFLSIILLTAFMAQGFSYELSAVPDGIEKSQTWKQGAAGWTSAKRNIQINMDVYNLDAYGHYSDREQAYAKVKYHYTNNFGAFTSREKQITDRHDSKNAPIIGGPGSVGPFINPGDGTPYTSINSVTIEVYRATTAVRAMAWCRADLSW